MSHCPDDGQPLTVTREGLWCRACDGRAVSDVALPTGSGRHLVLETRLNSGAFSTTRKCPQCEAAMAPWRIGQQAAWVAKCPACELFWLSDDSRRRLRNFSVPPARTATPPDLAPQATELTRTQTVLSWLGFPIIVGAEGDHPPIATVLLCAMVLVLFLFGMVDPDDLGPEALGYVAHESSPGQALTANLVHFGWLHLLGNLYFLFAFGEGLEHKAPRWVYLSAFFGLGAVSIWCDGLTAQPGVLIGGASGAVAVVMGACLVVQPRAKVLTSLALLLSPMVMLAWLGVRFASERPLTPPAVWLPIWLYGAFELGFQVVMFMLDVPGVAWVAHLSGLLLGIALGFLVRRVWPQNERT